MSQTMNNIQIVGEETPRRVTRHVRFEDVFAGFSREARAEIAMVLLGKSSCLSSAVAMKLIVSTTMAKLRNMFSLDRMKAVKRRNQEN